MNSEYEDSEFPEAPAEMIAESFLSKMDYYVAEGYEPGDVLAAMVFALADFSTQFRSDFQSNEDIDF